MCLVRSRAVLRHFTLRTVHSVHSCPSFVWKKHHQLHVFLIVNTAEKKHRPITTMSFRPQLSQVAFPTTGQAIKQQANKTASDQRNVQVWLYLEALFVLLQALLERAEMRTHSKTTRDLSWQVFRFRSYSAAGCKHNASFDWIYYCFQRYYLL